MPIEIYMHVSPSQRAYVGIASRGMSSRWRRHVRDANSGSTYPLHRAMRKHTSGWEHFVLEVCATWADACEAERFWIESFGTHISRGGLNATAGGDGTLSPSDETRAKLRRARKKMWQSPEYRAKQGAAHSAALASPEHRVVKAAAMAEVWQRPEHRAKILSAAPAIRKALWQSPEYREKQSSAHARAMASTAVRANLKARWQTPEYRERQGKAFTAVAATPEYREMRRQEMRARWQAPGYRDKISAGLRASWARRKAQKC